MDRRVSRLFLAALVGLFTAAAAASDMPPDPELVARLGAKRVAQLQTARLGGRSPWDELHAPLRLDRRDRADRVDGTGTCLIVLWQFVDHPADEVAHPNGAYVDLLFSAGTHPTGSMNDFYREASFGAYGIAGGVAGWTTATATYASYANPDGSQDPYTAREMIRDAIAQLDPVLDFSQYDNDGPDGIPDSGDDDGRVDAFFFVHAGPGQEATGDIHDIWSHASALAWGGETDDGVSVYRYSVEPEEMPDGELITVGVFCHEYGHVLGLPDLYDTDGSSQGIGEYGLMASGSWNHRPGETRGSRPSQLCAWSKWQLGWVEPVTLTASQYDVALPPAATDPVAYRIWRSGDPAGEEFYLVENRQNLGFDEGLVRRQAAHGWPLSHGLAIYHIDEAVSGNANELHRRVDVVDASPWFHADGTWHETFDGVKDPNLGLSLANYCRGDNGDLWPGFTAYAADSTNWLAPRDRDLFAPYSQPAAIDYDCDPVNIAIEAIREDGLTVHADLLLDPPLADLPGPSHESAWDFEAGLGGWSLCNSHAHVDQTLAGSCPGDGGLWFGQDFDGCLGYGNDWNEFASILLAVDPVDPVVFHLVHRYETEPGYDYCWVECRPAIAGTAWTTLASFNGTSACRTDEWTIPQNVVDAGIGSGWVGARIQIRLRFTSDSGWSCEDGLWEAIGWWIDEAEVAYTTVTGAPGLASGLGAVLSPANPNPFNPATELRYHVPGAGANVVLTVIDPRGHRVRTLVDERIAGGWRIARWDGCDERGRQAASGVYFARLEVEGTVQVQKLSLLK